MATAQYETRSRTVTETAVVLVLTEDEADDLRALITASASTPSRVSILEALTSPTGSTDTFDFQGTTYEMGVWYQDDGGDDWTFRHSPDGLPVSTADSWSEGRTLAYVVQEYGPLRKRGE
ncbi:phiSA1p31-related protein [Streptomyces sp. NPDC096057]|uniref:phiSA1p31-related protein n=1 Tax=Streptomyces sp. NPDC096057 TaxID=3155543 RepID=UPI003318F8EE